MHHIDYITPYIIDNNIYIHNNNNTHVCDIWHHCITQVIYDMYLGCTFRWPHSTRQTSADENWEECVRVWDQWGPAHQIPDTGGYKKAPMCELKGLLFSENQGRSTRSEGWKRQVLAGLWLSGMNHRQSLDISLDIQAVHHKQSQYAIKNPTVQFSINYL